MKNLLLTAIIIIVFSHFCAISQNVVITDFEDLIVPEEGYFNGSTQHSGTIGVTEKFVFQSINGTFRVFYTPENGYDYWSGTAYSNQTDLNTADWTNFSSYSNYPNGGGCENTENYAIGYMFDKDTIQFDVSYCCGIQIANGAYFTNSTWAYHYMNGTDGTGNGIYETGDYYKLIFKSMVNNQYTGNFVEFYLADFTNGNSYIIDNWTWVDLSALGETHGIEISYQTSDDFTPAYYCVDNLTLDYVANTENLNNKYFNIYPNPFSDFIKIENIEEANISLSDITGKVILEKKNCSGNIELQLSNLKSGLYFINIKTKTRTYTHKIIK